MKKKHRKQGDVAAQNQPVIQCPFFRSDNGADRISCEGILEGSTLALVYERKADMMRQREVFCCEHFRKCEVYCMLMEKKYDMEA